MSVFTVVNMRCLTAVGGRIPLPAAGSGCNGQLLLFEHAVMLYSYFVHPSYIKEYAGKPDFTLL